MKKELFREWLENKYEAKAIASTALSCCNKVEKYHGDLDRNFLNDKCEKVLYLLTYSANDERMKKNPKHDIPINGSIRKTTASYKKYVKLYKTFCEQKSEISTQNTGATKNTQSGYMLTGTKNKGELYERQIDLVLRNKKELDRIFIDTVVGFSEDPGDLDDIRYLAYQSFSKVEGEWFFKEEEDGHYIKIVPSRIMQSSRLKVFFNELFRRNESVLLYLLKKRWAEEHYDQTSLPVDDEIYLEMRDIEEIRRNITG